jgi:hypothetical protein
MPALTTDAQNAAQARVNQPFLMIYLDVAGDPVWAWTGKAPLTITLPSDPILSTTRTFVGAGDVASVSGITHAADGSVQSVTLALGQADYSDPSMLSFVNTEANWSRRTAVVWMGFVDVNTGAAITPVRMLTGRMTSVTAADGAKPGVVVKISSKAAYDGGRRSGWQLTDKHQKTFWPGDAALIFVPQLVAKELRFGVADQVQRTKGTGGASSINVAERGSARTALR